MTIYIRPSKAVIIFTLLGIGIIVTLISNFGPSIILNILTIGGLSIFLYFLLVMPYSITINDEFIRVNRLLYPIKFNRKKIKISSFTYNNVRESARLWASGGIFGYTGWYSTSGVGKYYLSALNLKDIALIEKDNGKKYVINIPIYDPEMQKLMGKKTKLPSSAISMF
ncbi:PH domain-containing protein [Bacteroides coprosuis]|uniref:PH domain-containing protein n=1 Tax=Bacteroides coprosuis TaxID=151276 RepID=UPI001D5D12D5|nr:PH domain-containing protein [Bacteroides coprosuis]HJD93022.1 PH domain-containing protein [Bacteroides coprosuis]